MNNWETCLHENKISDSSFTYICKDCAATISCVYYGSFSSILGTKIQDRILEPSEYSKNRLLEWEKDVSG